MQNIQRDIPTSFRERLSPSLWIFAAAALVGPMVALVFTPVDGVVAIIAGVAASLAIVAVLIAVSPVVEVREGWLRAGRARIEPRYLGAPAVYTGDAARTQRGAQLDRRSWHLIRGGIDGLVVVPIDDPDDPVPAWVISSRTPDRLAAAIERARS